MLAAVERERGTSAGFDVKVGGERDPALVSAMAAAGATDRLHGLFRSSTVVEVRVGTADEKGPARITFAGAGRNAEG